LDGQLGSGLGHEVGMAGCGNLFLLRIYHWAVIGVLEHGRDTSQASK
jgi:hypothetical protein